MDTKKKALEVKRLSDEAKTLYAEMESDEAKRTPENREKLDKILADGEKLQGEILQAKRLEALGEFTDEPEEKRERENPAPEQKTARSWGGAFTESDEFKSAIKNGHKTTDSVEVKLLHSDTDAAGGILIYPQRRPGVVDRAFVNETSLLDLLTVAPTSSNAVPYVVLTGFTNNAAGVKDYDTDSQNFGLKPQSGLGFTAETAPVETIAHWFGVHRNLLADVPALRGIIDGKAFIGLRRKLEDYIVDGTGTSPQIRGIKNTSGIQERFADSPRTKATDTKADQLKRALTDVKLAFGMPNAIVVNPVIAEELELIKDDNNQYVRIYDPVTQRLWRTPVVENRKLTDDEYLVGDFKMGCTLFMRENANIRLSENFEDWFARNAVLILAELRAALTVEQPEFFVDGSFSNE